MLTYSAQETQLDIITFENRSVSDEIKFIIGKDGEKEHQDALRSLKSHLMNY